MLVLPPALPAAAVFNSYVDGRLYSVTLTDVALQQAPAWSPTQDHPPLGARAALAAASRQLAALLDNANDWQNTLISLKSPAGDDHWVYVLTFEGLPRTSWAERLEKQSLRLVVLMDGRVIEPFIRDLHTEGGSAALVWMEPGGGMFPETRCDGMDRLSNALSRQERLPGTDYVLELLDQRPGRGAFAAARRSVEIHYTAYVLDKPEIPPVQDMTLRFRMGHGDVGRGVDAAVSGLQVGGRRTVVMREEVAAGIREAWPRLPAQSQVVVTLTLVAVAD